MNILNYLDTAIILQKILLLFFIMAHYKYTKFAFVSFLVEFEKLRFVNMKNKIFFFITSLLFTSIAAIFFFYFFLLIIGLVDFELLKNNVNLFFALNIFTVLYSFRKLYFYTTMGSLSLHNINASMLSKETKKLKFLNEE